jgi:hypothetical protein
MEEIRMYRDGVWSHGKKSTRWTLNPSDLKHGWYITLRDGSSKDVMVSMADPLPRPRNKTKRQMMSLVLRSDSGAHYFRTASVGGMRAVSILIAAIQARIQRSSVKLCPVVQLRSMSYSHEKYGKIYVPDFKIVGWTDPTGKAGARRPVHPQMSA